MSEEMIETTFVQPDYADVSTQRQLINAVGHLIDEMVHIGCDGSGADLGWWCDSEEEVERVTEAIKSLGLRVVVCDFYADHVVERRDDERWIRKRA